MTEPQEMLANAAVDPRAVAYWNSRAATWSQIQGSPLVLNVPEASIFRAHAPRTGTLLVLGATPALVACAPQLRVTSVDFAEAIVDLARRPDVTYHIASWLDMPVATASQDYVVGCGSLLCLRWEDEYHRMFQELMRVMAPGGKLALRLYDPQVIWQRGHVPKFSEMLQLRDESHNVEPARIDRAEYAQAAGVVYSFPPVDLVLALARSCGLELGSYTSAGRELNFPIAVFTRP